MNCRCWCAPFGHSIVPLLGNCLRILVLPIPQFAIFRCSIQNFRCAKVDEKYYTRKKYLSLEKLTANITHAWLSHDIFKTCVLIGLREIKTAEAAHTRNLAIVTRPFSSRREWGLGTRLQIILYRRNVKIFLGKFLT